jgi:protein ImuA
MHAVLRRQEDLFSPPAATPPSLLPVSPAPESEAVAGRWAPEVDAARPGPALVGATRSDSASVDAGRPWPAAVGAAKPWPAAVDAALWRGDELGQAVAEVQPTGFAALDRELPGGGWPCRSLTELLQPQPGALEWRLLGPALRALAGAGRGIVLVSPPWRPHLPGLRQVGLDERHLVWVQAETVAERLWCTEQLIKANAFGALVTWLPQARPEQVRRLQVCALASEGLVFLCRPAAAQHESSAAPLRVLARPRPDWMLDLKILKRRGPAHEQPLELPAVPRGLQKVLTPRTTRPSRLLPTPIPSTPATTPATTPTPSVPAGTAPAAGAFEGAADAVGSTAPATRPRRYAAVR